MVSPLAEKQFAELWNKINLEIESDHKNYWPRIKGYLANKLGQVRAAGASANAVTAMGVALSYFVGKVPFVGGALSTATDQAVNAGKMYMTKKKMATAAATDPEYGAATGEWWLKEGLQGYIDAVRKYDDAARDYAKLSVTNCATYQERLAKFLYARYRLRRLESFHAMMAAFQERIGKQIDDARKDWDKWVAEAQKHGPEFFDKDKEGWHFANCKDFCMYPWRGDTGISRPFNVQGHPPPLPPRPMR